MVWGLLKYFTKSSIKTFCRKIYQNLSPKIVLHIFAEKLVKNFRKKVSQNFSSKSFEDFYGFKCKCQQFCANPSEYTTFSDLLNVELFYTRRSSIVPVNVRKRYPLLRFLKYLKFCRNFHGEGVACSAVPRPVGP